MFFPSFLQIPDSGIQGLELFLVPVVLIILGPFNYFLHFKSMFLFDDVYGIEYPLEFNF